MLIGVILSLLCIGPAAADIAIDLSRYSPDRNPLYKGYFYSTSDRTKITLSNIAQDVGFLVVQVHTQFENVTLSNSSKIVYGSYVSGTNLGLVWSASATTATFYLLRNIKVGNEVHFLLAVTVYDEYAPFEVISYTNDYLTVKSQPASAYGVSCDANPIKIEMFHYYFNHYDSDSQTYFDGIAKMLTVGGIRNHSRLVGKDIGYRKHNRMFSNYRGRGRVFVVVASYKGRSAAYVPAVSYGCDALNWRDDCVDFSSEFWKVSRTFLLILGGLLCFQGHKMFRLTIFLIGFIFGILITFVVLSVEHANHNGYGVISLVIGIFYGVFWLFVWWKFGVPLLSVQLSLILSGGLVASIAFYQLGDYNVFASDINYWLTFACIIMAYMIIGVAAMVFGHIVSCALIGSYAVTAAISYYIDGNMEFIFENFFRRVVVKDFGYAVLNPPFLVFTDTFLCILWGLLFVTGIIVQLRHQRNRSPFPPNRNVSLERPLSETTPLLYSETYPTPPEYSENP
nr:unnamed protein product [Callosobruchus chinensis]